MSRKESQRVAATLIINDPQSAIDILRLLGRFARVFSQFPIHILRGDIEEHEGEIMRLSEHFKIATAPALIARNGTVILGNAAICEFIPKLARVIGRMEGSSAAGARGAVPSGPKLPRELEEDPYTSYINGIRMQGEDEDLVDEDQKEKRQAQITASMAHYKDEMSKRHVPILADAGQAPAKSVVETARKARERIPQETTDIDARSEERRAELSRRAVAAAGPQKPLPPQKALPRLLASGKSECRDATDDCDARFASAFEARVLDETTD